MSSPPEVVNPANQQKLRRGMNQVFHAAGASPGGWTIMAVHESKQSWEKFRDEILLPRMQAGIAGGFPTPPQETEIDVSTVMP